MKRTKSTKQVESSAYGRRLSGRCVVGALVVVLTGPTLPAQPKQKPVTVRDVLWVWGNPELAKPGEHTAASFAEASPAQRARILGTPNVLMAGGGVPHDRALALKWSAEVAGAPRQVWKIYSDGQEDHQPPFEFKRRIADLASLVKTHPQIEAVLVDDMTSVGAAKGFKPEHLKSIKSLLKAQKLPLKLWGVLYTMNFSTPTTDPLVRELDVINLWHWHAKDTARMEAHVAECEKRYPGKPIVLGLYMYDYGDGRRMPLDLHVKQCETALRLLHAKRVTGIVLLSVSDDEQVVKWTADWIKRVGSQKVGEPQAKDRTRARSASEGRLKPSSRALRASLRIGDGSGWSFSGERWSESAQGVISPPDKWNLHSRAFYTKQAFRNFSAEFEFNGSYREVGSGGAGLIFRAKDANHFHAVYFPWGAQQLVGRHFWASVVKVDGDSYLRSVKSAWVPGVPAQTERWYKVRVEVKGAQIAVWVDGRRALSMMDDGSGQGAVGLIGYGMYYFRNVRISGEGVAAPAWNDKQAIPVHHFTVGLDSHYMPSGCIAPNGDVLLAAGHLLVRSKDRGRTWEKPEQLPEKFGELGNVDEDCNTLFQTAKGRLIVQIYRDRVRTKKPVPEILMTESKDNGHTWTAPVPSKIAGGWPDVPHESGAAELYPYGPLLETKDGTLVRFLFSPFFEPGSKSKNDVTWGSFHGKAFAIRSTDGGKGWSRPIELDQPSWYETPRGTIPGSMDLTEPTGVAIGNKVLVLLRPIYSPTMWQYESADAGASWDASARTTFPGYAQSLLRTRSGAIVCAHRYPHYSVNTSHDGGLNWDEGTVIDYPVWAMGCLVEVEPDVVLCTYMNRDRKDPLLAQLFRVTPQGIRPVAAPPAAARAGEPVEPLAFRHARVTDAWQAYAKVLPFGKGQTLALVDDGCTLSMPEWSKSSGDQPKVLVAYNSVDGNNDPRHKGKGYHGSTIGKPSSLNYNGKWGVAYNDQVAVIRALECCHCAIGDSKTLAAGLQWVLDNHKKYRITTVNLAPVDDQAHDRPVPTEIDDKLTKLRQAGIWVSAPTGNHHFTTGISWPACQPDCFAIGAVRPGKDEVYLDRHAKVDLVVPADATSSSNAIACGAVILLREAIEKARYDWKADGRNLPEAMLAILQKTGKPVADPATKRTYQRLDVKAALDHVFTRAAKGQSRK